MAGENPTNESPPLRLVSFEYIVSQFGISQQDLIDIIKVHDLGYFYDYESDTIWIDKIKFDESVGNRNIT